MSPEPVAGQVIADLARVLSGLEVGRSISRVPFGAALEPYDRLRSLLIGIGWHPPEDYERELRRIFGLGADSTSSDLDDQGRITPFEKAGGHPASGRGDMT